jgi:integrase
MKNMKNGQYTTTVTCPGRARAVHEPLTLEQVKALMNAANPEWFGIILLALYTGLRLLDLARLTWDTVDLDKSTIHFQMLKTSRSLTVPIPPELVSYFKSLAKPANTHAPLFQTCFEDARQRPSRLSLRFRSMQLNAGLKPVGFHCLRLTFLWQKKNLPVPADVARKSAGHTGAPYSPVCLDTLKQDLSKLQPIQ